MIDELETLLKNAGLLVFYDEEGVWLPPDRDVYAADSAGALWNYFMAWEDRSKGVHDPGYIKGLLESSIEFMQGTPRFTAPTVADGQNRKAAR